jgi:PAS domain S-box-containing protein
MVLRLLHLEDDSNDRELVGAALRADGIECVITPVASRATFVEELADAPDLILADFALPGFDGITAQELAQQLCPDVPFVFVSGSLGEEVAVERVKAGATDYVLKHRLERLPGAVRRAIQEARNRRAKDFLEQLIASSPSMIFRLDADQHPTYISPNVSSVLGYSVEEILNKPAFWQLVVHPDDLGLVGAAIQRAAADPAEQIEGEYRFRRKDGEYRWCYSLIRIDQDAHGRLESIVGYALDVADRKAAEQALERARQDAVAARDEAQRANQAKSEFLSRMSHDLRTPLNSILGFAQVLELDALTPEHADHVAQILSAGKHLLDLINEVLDISRIEAGHLSLSTESVSLPEVVRQCLDIVQPLAAQRRVTLMAHEGRSGPPFARADRQRLRQILINLLSNAVKYNRDGGTVRVEYTDRGDGTVSIEIADTGAGLPPEKIARLFKPFERLGAERTAVEGTGLGLALSKALAEAMDGQLRASSIVEKGSTFTVILPKATAAHVVESVETDLPASRDVAHSGTLLCIEDNLQNLRLMQRLLARRPGVQLAHAADGAQGLAYIREHWPRLVFLDLHLPDMHGEEVLRQVKKDPAARGTTVVVLSADATPSQKRHLMAEGASHYITKPFDVREVLQVIDAALGSEVTA